MPPVGRRDVTKSLTTMSLEYEDLDTLGYVPDCEATSQPRDRTAVKKMRALPCGFAWRAGT